MEQEKLVARRNYSAQFRALVLEQCVAPGTSVAVEQGDSQMIRIDVIWLAIATMDMLACTETAYLFNNKRTNCIKVLMHDGIGI